MIEGAYYAGSGVQYGRTYDIAPDGKRFLMLKEGTDDATGGPSIIIVQHWLEELKRLVPRD